MIINYYYYWEGAGRGIRLKDMGRKKKKGLKGRKIYLLL